MYNLDWFLLKLEKQMRKSKVLKDIFEAILVGILETDKNAEETTKQTRPSTATILLDEWEREFGIEPRKGYDVKFRQKMLLAKEKGEGSITLQVIKETAESFTGAEVAVSSDTDESLIFIKFVGTIGIPKAMEDLKNAIDDIIPAHMEVQYEYVYNTWADVRRLTWGQLKAYTWRQVKEVDLFERNT